MFASQIILRVHSNLRKSRNVSFLGSQGLINAPKPSMCGFQVSGFATNRDLRKPFDIIGASYLPVNGARCFLDTQSDLASKIETLRRDIFWTRCIAGAAALCLAAVSVANWRRHPRTLDANEFLLKDQAGNVTARLGRDNFGDTCLTLTAKEHVAVANLCVQDTEGSSLDLHNLRSESRAMLTPGFNSYEPLFSFQPALVINQAMNTHFASLNMGTETMLVMGHNSKESVRISSPAGEPRITLFGANENPMWSTH
jgi:hypothetical protein